MTIVPFEVKHWAMLQLWWHDRKFPTPPLEFMPQNGYLVKMNDHYVCAGFLTMTDANVAVAGHFVSDPRVPGEYRNGALDLLISHLVQRAKSVGVKAVFMSTTIPRLKERFLKHGFELTDAAVDVFGRRIDRGG